MLFITRSKQFNKNHTKLPTDIQIKFRRRLELFIVNQNMILFNRHKLRGGYSGCESINITGDYRVILKWVTDNHIHLLRIGTHSQLYE